MYEATTKNGRSLHERAQTSHDRQHLENLLAELKDSWDTIGGKSMERYDKVNRDTFKFLLSVVKKYAARVNIQIFLVCFSQTTQAGGSAAVLRSIH